MWLSLFPSQPRGSGGPGRAPTLLTPGFDISFGALLAPGSAGLAAVYSNPRAGASVR